MPAMSQAATCLLFLAVRASLAACCVYPATLSMLIPAFLSVLLPQRYIPALQPLIFVVTIICQNRLYIRHYLLLPRPAG